MSSEADAEVLFMEWKKAYLRKEIRALKERLATLELELGEINKGHTPISELNLTRRTELTLRRGGFLSVQSVLHFAFGTQDNLLAVRGFGDKMLGELRDKLIEGGYTSFDENGGGS